jgi:hypothetical protein
VIAVAVISRSAMARDTEFVRVELLGPNGCIDEATFFSEVRGRLSHVRLAPATIDVDRTLKVEVDRTPAGATGTLVIVDEHGGATQRSLSGDSCESVVSGLAWVAARAIDPEASLTPIAVAAVTAPAPVSPPPTPPLFPCAALPPREERPAPPAPVMQPPQRWRLTLGATGSVLGVAAPQPVLDVGVFAQMARESRSFVAPELGLSLHHTTSADVDIPETSGTFAWTFARGEVCPLRFELGASADLRACGLFDAGFISASGGAGTGFDSASHLRPWVTVGELARIEWPIVKLLVLEAEGGLALPLVRETFAFNPSATVAVYEAPVVVGLATLGLGVRFP